MNIYILVEGQSEKYIYPAWLNVLLPEMTAVRRFDEVNSNNYYIFSSGGVPNVLTDVVNAVQEVNQVRKYDYLVVILDADDCTVNDRTDEVFQAIESAEVTSIAQVVVIVQNKCVETWCLGNRRVFSRNPRTIEFASCSQFYSVKDDDPEQLPLDATLTTVSTVSQYHEYYLRKMLHEKNLSYGKGKRTKSVQNSSYLEEMVKRADETSHLKSFSNFLAIIRSFRAELHSNASEVAGTES